MRLRDIYKQINRPVDSVDQLIVLSLSNKTLTFLAARLGPDVYLSCYLPDFDQTLKEGSCDHL